MGMQKFVDIATTCCSFADGASVEHWSYTVLVLKCWRAFKVIAVVFFWITVDKHLTHYEI